MRNLIAGSLLAAALGTASIPAAAHSRVDFFVNVPPPAVRYEYVPAPRVGWVWAPGYWAWRHGHHYWVRGHYVRHRPGYYYEPARWVDDGGRYYYHAPGWRPGDGYPARYDRYTYDSYRR